MVSEALLPVVVGIPIQSLQLVRVILSVHSTLRSATIITLHTQAPCPHTTAVVFRLPIMLEYTQLVHIPLLFC